MRVLSEKDFLRALGNKEKDFSDVVLHHKSDLRKVEMLENLDFSNAKLCYSNFSGIIFSNCNLNGTDFTGSNLSNVIVRKNCKKNERTLFGAATLANALIL